MRKRDAEKIAREVRKMRALIAQEKGDSDPWDLKLVKGGLMDIEFVAQYLSLAFAHAQPGNSRRLDPQGDRQGGRGGPSVGATKSRR